jgi:hypothetical protein
MQEDMGLGRSVFFFFIFFSIYLLLLLLLLCSHDGFPLVNAAEQATYYLGFLSPFPDLKEDALIPSGLSQQWYASRLVYSWSFCALLSPLLDKSKVLPMLRIFEVLPQTEFVMRCDTISFLVAHKNTIVQGFSERLYGASCTIGSL